MMDHPNIAKVLDVGSTDTGRPYFVMELVRGSPITEYADKHRLSTRERVALAAQVCRAVQHAHSKGIIHRDLKPSNVLVTVVDDKPVPKVIDFGIAKATQSKLTDRTLFTAFRQLIGTPQYMSPEQADSGGSDIDTRTDVYSLGVLLYELLVGATPIDARELRSAAYEAMRKMIRDTDLPRPATRLLTLAADNQSAIASARSTDIRRLSDSVKGELDWIVMKSLEKDRSRRYETAAAFADDLNRYLSGEAVLAGPVSGMYRLKKTLKRYKAAAAIGGAIAACLILGIAGTTWGLIREARQRHAAEAAQQVAIIQREKAQAVVDFLTKDLLAKANPEITRDHTLSETLVIALIEPAMANVDQRFADRPAVRAAIQSTLAVTLTKLGRYDLAEKEAKDAWDADRVAPGEEDPDSLTALWIYGLSMNKLGHHAEAEPLLKQCWETERRVQGETNSDTLKVLTSYGLSIDQQGRYAEAEPLLKRAWDERRKTYGDDDPETLVALSTYANAVDGLGRVSEAEALYKKCWDGFRKALGDDHPNTLMALINYGQTLSRQGRDTDAAPLLKEAWESLARVVGASNPQTLVALSNYASVLDNLGRVAEAVVLRKQCWQDGRKAWGDEHEHTLIYEQNYGKLLIDLQRYAEAEPILKHCWETSHRVLGDKQDTTLAALLNYAQAVDGLGRHAEAEPLFRLRLQLGKQTQQADNPGMLLTIYNLATCVSAQSRVTEAARLLKQNWEASQRVSGGEAWLPIAWQLLYANVLDEEGQHAEAEPAMKHAWEASRRASGDNDPLTIACQASDLIAIDALGRHSEAEPLLKLCWENSRRVNGEDNETTLATQSGYAAAMDAQGRHANAEPLLRRALDAMRRLYPGSSDFEPALLNLGRCLVASEKWTDAEPILRECLTWDRAHVDPERPDIVPQSLPLLNQCLKAQGKPVEASTLPATRP